MTGPLPLPPGVDPGVPAPARIYDYLLGGSLNFESDRMAADKVQETMPEAVDAAWANRGFHQRAARWLAQQGVSQFVSPCLGAPPAVVHAGAWGADDPELADSDGSRWLYCGVGRCP